MRRSRNSTSPLAQALYRYKDERRLSVEEMGAALGVNWLSIHYLLRGGALGSVKTVKTLAKMFEWTMSEVGAMAMYEGETAARAP